MNPWQDHNTRIMAQEIRDSRNKALLTIVSVFAGLMIALAVVSLAQRTIHEALNMTPHIEGFDE